MAEERDPHFHSRNKTSTISPGNDDSDLSVITVIEKNETINRSKTKVTKKYDDADNVSIDDVKTEVILLDEAPAGKITRNHSRTCDNRRVIELSDTISKMELRRQFKVDVAGREGSAGVSGGSRRKRRRGGGRSGGGDDDDDDDGSAEILSRLPPGTILIKQRNTGSTATRSVAREDSDYVHESSKDSTESNSSGSSGATLYTPAGKVKRMQHRAARSKKIVEVRRNPVRNKKKKPIDDDFSRPRQRLLSVKRKSAFVVDPVTRKRAKIAPLPYMNTRSVTRKMYTVGATYQAPTIHDAIEWKEWPAHGMNERPVWHPQFGLTYGYNDRHFLSLDGRNYREIVDDPVIEVVSVDPHSENVLHASGGRDVDTTTSSDRQTRENQTNDCITDDVSFEACMHGSLHSVLAYCARVVTPAYKNTVGAKFAEPTTKSIDRPVDEKSPKPSKTISDVDRNSGNDGKIVVETASVRSKTSTKFSESTNVGIAGTSSCEVTKCLVVPRRTISFTNVRNIQGNILHEVFGRASKNTLIFLKPTDSPAKTDKITAKSSTGRSTATSANDSADRGLVETSIGKIDDNAISDEALMKMTSMYDNKSMANETVEKNVGKNFAEAKFAITGKVVGKVSKTSPSGEAKDRQTSSVIPNFHSATPNAQNSVPPKNADPARNSRFSNANQAAEIAKILAEYNQKAAKNSATKIACRASSKASNAASTTANAGNPEKDCVDRRTVRATFFSVVGQPKTTKKDEDFERKTYRGCNVVSNADVSGDRSVVGENDDKTDVPVKTEVAEDIGDDDGRAIDLSTGKSRKSEIQKRQNENKPEESTNQQWLQELIEDTALLYCAATGVRQNDVADYLDTLDSTQSIEWLGS